MCKTSGPEIGAFGTNSGMLAKMLRIMPSTAQKVIDKGKTTVQLLCGLPAVQHSAHLGCISLGTRQGCCRQRESVGHL